MRLHRILAACALACAAAIPAAAEERAWFLAGNSLTEVAVTAGGREWTPTWSIALPQHQPFSPIVWGGGRYLVWSASRDDGHWLVRVDTRSRQLAVFPITLDGPASLAVDRATTHLIVLGPSALYRIDVARLAVIAQLAMPGVATEARSVAVAQGRIFAGRNTEDGSIREVVVLDQAFAEMHRIPGVWYAQASRDERHVYLQTATFYGVVAQAWDVGTLTQIATGTVGSWAHTVGGLLVSLSSWGAAALYLAAFDLNTLVRTAAAVVPQPHTVRDLAELVQPAPSSAFVIRSHSCLYSVCGRSIQVFDARTFTMVRQMWQAPFDTVGSKLLMLGPPDPLGHFNAVENVTTRTVLLTWQPPPDIGEYEVVVGSAPGLSDVATIRTGGVPYLMIRGVPPATYYVRVRAMNDAGAVESEERRIEAR
jgi:hypothetical protein